MTGVICHSQQPVSLLGQHWQPSNWQRRMFVVLEVAAVIYKY
jgi:hypothetical protein